MVFPPIPGYFKPMTLLASLKTCLAEGLNGVAAIAPDLLPPAHAVGHVLARDVSLPQDMPPRTEALRAGYAVAALDLVGASPGVPVPMASPVMLDPGQALPPGLDALLPEEGAVAEFGSLHAIREAMPGEGVRHVGHDGRAGAVLAQTGTRVSPQLAMVCGLAGIAALAVRRPRVRIALENPVLAQFAAHFVQDLGAVIVNDAAQLTVTGVRDHQPRLALAPCETGWLGDSETGLTLFLPTRFDGAVTALLALGLPALAHLSAASRIEETHNLARKLASGVGMAELVLLRRDIDLWHPLAPGMVTLSALCSADAFAIVPPESEGLAAGARLSATSLHRPFG